MRRCQVDVACRVIVGEDAPDFRTISDFRKIHLARLEALFVEVLKLCALAGLARVGTIALDGTKVKANAAALEHADAVTQSELLSKRAMMGFEGWKFSQTEQDKALERRFQKIIVDEPTVEATIAILRGLQEKYEIHHGVEITDPAIVAAAELYPPPPSYATHR